uniref:Uncharacterized protein n=1 Tax=Fagus sylvatica TaxID=28930 RepID=A0A2N9IIJ4_FAGSY
MAPPQADNSAQNGYRLGFDEMDKKWVFCGDGFSFKGRWKWRWDGELRNGLGEEAKSSCREVSTKEGELEKNSKGEREEISGKKKE